MLTIRPFNQNDRQKVRQICCDVADRGEPIEAIFPDREFAADILTKYYTDYEPENTFVAEFEGRVVGYINGCFDNRRYGLVLIFLIIPSVLIKGIIRGTYFYSEFWKIMGAMLRNWRRAFQWRKKSFDSHQGHLHIGVLKDARHQRVGERLMKAFLSHASKARVNQITASVHDGNVGACRFFEHLGFIAKERYPMVMVDGQSIREYHSISYVKSTA